MGIRPGQDGRERNPLRLGDDVMLAPQLPSIGRVRARLGPPSTARTDAESTTALDQSSLSAPRSLARSAMWSCCPTPARCQVRRYRQQVMPEPHPSSWGSASQELPVFKTNRIPVSTLRGSRGLRPGHRARLGLGGGHRGLRSSPRSSSNSGLAMGIPPHAGVDTWSRDENHTDAQSFC
jgi:hypothetical protein